MPFLHCLFGFWTSTTMHWFTGQFSFSNLTVCFLTVGGNVICVQESEEKGGKKSFIRNKDIFTLCRHLVASRRLVLIGLQKLWESLADVLLFDRRQQGERKKRLQTPFFSKEENRKQTKWTVEICLLACTRDVFLRIYKNKLLQLCTIRSNVTM